MEHGAVSKGKGGVYLNIHVQPAAKCEAVRGLHGGAIKVALRAPARDGKANMALLDFVANQLMLPKSGIRLVSGQTSRRKRIFIAGDPDTLAQRIEVQLVRS